MAAVNKVILVGHLGRDPEVRYTPDGRAICNFTMATTDTWKDKNSGEKREKTEWHRIVVFGRLAEICGEYLAKGRQVYVEGRLQTRKWQGQDGQDRWTTEVVIDQRGTMQMLGSRGDNAGGGGGYRQGGGSGGGGYQQQGGGGGYQQQGGGGGYQQGGQGGGDYNSPPAYPENDDDIPF